MGSRKKTLCPLLLYEKLVQARAEHSTSKMPLNSAAGSAPVITHTDSKITITMRRVTNYTCGFVWVGGGGCAVGCIRALGSQTCNSMCLSQMDVFQKWLYPSIKNTKHASWTPVWHTCRCIIYTLDAIWASDGNYFDRQASNLCRDWHAYFKRLIQM